MAFALLVVAALVPSTASALTAPASDPFYTQPANIAQYPHGTILRERKVTLSGATQTDAAAAYQLMYATTNATGQPVAAVTTVMVPTSPAPGPRRLASYQTYYDSLTLNCAPSYTLQGGQRRRRDERSDRAGVDEPAAGAGVGCGHLRLRGTG